MSKQNQRIQEKRKQRKTELLEQARMNELYEQAKLDPDTVEGQMYIKQLPIQIPPKIKQTRKIWNYIPYFNWFS